MGDLKGHAIPGSFFLLYGLWWAVSCLRRHLSCKKNGGKYTSTSTYPLDCFQGAVSRLPMEGFLKVVLSAGGMLGELLAHLPVPPVGIVQHATMYFLFLISGIVDIGVHYGMALPPKTDFASMMIALLVEALLFLSHVHGRSQLDTHIHMLLVYVILATVVVMALEARFSHSAILGMARAYLLMLQGSWFWAVGIILYGHGKNDGWDGDSADSVMHSSIYFSWHCAAHFILLVLLNAGIYCLQRRGETKILENTLQVTDKLQYDDNFSDDEV
ncbi:hypothetical protein BsWGS_13203 [Bradybaena similaris]